MKSLPYKTPSMDKQYLKGDTGGSTEFHNLSKIKTKFGWLCDFL
jgi:hypothetical protein